MMDSAASRIPVARGVTLETGRYGGSDYHLVRIDRTQADVDVKPYLTDRATGEQVSQMYDRAQALACVNGTFFELSTPGKVIYGEVKTDGRQHLPTMFKKRTYWAVRPDGAMEMGETVKDNQGHWSIPAASWRSFRYVLGGGGRVLKGGRPASEGAGINDEDFLPDVTARRNRTAVGFTADGHEMIVVSSDTPGWTPQEVAGFMQAEGMSDAMFLDSGGSTEMIVADKIVNRLSAGGERWEPTALMVVPRA